MQICVSRALTKSKMPSEQQRNSALTGITTQPEKPFHYTYLKEFRTQQCQDFLQHKCPNHRPFTCFHWHFLNQRRRRPIRKRGGTFNYSPDVYCTKYDDTTGICPDGDECQYLHRNTGDTERRYHLRYYKTGTCVHETDARGHCVKNGPHCAFAHGPHDLRQPVYDIREMSAPQPPPTAAVVEPPPTNGNGSIAAGTSPITTSGTSLEKEKIIIDDPVWNDTIYVLANYKTEPCKRPPRLCRQGYACPQYHNVRDRRRSPRLFRYRSTPCPNVKHGDEWGELSACDQGDECQYCHTRTEQQFHPEIYKSSKCNDMQQTGYCPRGPFCAFAHVDQEMSSQRDFNQELGNLPATPSSLYPVSSSNTTLGQHITSFGSGDNHNVPISSIGPGPIAKPRSNSASSSYSSESSHPPSSTFPKTVASDKEEAAVSLGEQYIRNYLEQEGASYLNGRDNHLEQEKYHNTVFSHGTTLGHLIAHTSQNQNQVYGSGSNMSANAMPFYPPSDTVESVIGNALDDLNLDDFDVSALDRELDNDNSSIGSSSASIGQITASLGLGSTSQPVNIPSGGGTTLNHKSSISESPASPLSQLPPAFVPHHIQQQKQQQQQIEQAAAAFMSRPNTGTNQSLRNIQNLGSLLVAPGSPVNTGRSSQSNMMSPGAGGGGNPGAENEVQRLQEEVTTLRKKLQTWEESWNQAKQACDAWKQEASDWAKKAEYADQERQAALHAKEEVMKESKVMKQEIEGLTGGPHLHVLHKVSELDNLPLSKLKQVQLQLRGDLERIDKLIHSKEALCCLICQSRQRSIAVLPCAHLAFCASCSNTQNECPICHQKITNKTNVFIPL